MNFNATRIMPVILCGVMSAMFAFYSLQQKWRTWGWWEVPAKLVSAEVKPPFPSPNGMGAMRHAIAVEYTYTVEGKEHTGAGIRLKEAWFATKEDAEVFANRWRMTTPLTAHVNPKDPREAYLDPHANWQIPLIPAGLLAGLALIFLVKPTRYHRSHERMNRPMNPDEAELQT